MYRIGLLCFLTVMIFSCHRNVNMVYQKDVFKTISGKKISIKCYHHASLAIEYDGCIMQIDPVIDNSRGIDYKREGKADYIFVTHEHFDHFDPKAIEQLSKANTKIVLTNIAVR